VPLFSCCLAEFLERTPTTAMQFSRCARAACPPESANGTSPLTRFSAVRPCRSLEEAGLSKLNSMSPTLASQAGEPVGASAGREPGVGPVRPSCRYRFQASPVPGHHSPSARGGRGRSLGQPAVVKCHRIPRKEVIQPQLPLRLPCYDFTPITDPAFDGSLPCGLGHRLRAFPAFVV
jgi:hypothetical protein